MVRPLKKKKYFESSQKAQKIVGLGLRTIVAVNYVLTIKDLSTFSYLFLF